MLIYIKKETAIGELRGHFESSLRRLRMAAIFLFLLI